MVGDISETSYQSFRQVKFFGSLNGLRCMSILLVIWHHYPVLFMVDVVPGLRFGFLGVDLFFVISGFLIVTLILRERSKTGGVSLRKFYSRRALRIFPLYYGVLALLLIKAAIAGFDTPRSAEVLSDLPILALYLKNWIAGAGTFGLAWSLAAEEQFYAVWPPIEKFLSKHVMKILVGLLVLSQVIQLGLVDPVLQSLLGWAPDEPGMLRETTFTPILLGVLLAHLLHQPASFDRVARVLGQKFVAPVLAIALVVGSNFFPDNIRGLTRPMVQLLMCGLVGACVVREDNGLSWLLRQPAIARVGEISYGIYLLHHFGIELARKVLAVVGWQSGFSLLFLGTLLTYLLAELSFRFYESKFLSLRSRFQAVAS